MLGVLFCAIAELAERRANLRRPRARTSNKAGDLRSLTLCRHAGDIFVSRKFFPVSAFFKCRHAVGTDGVWRTGRRLLRVHLG